MIKVKVIHWNRTVCIRSTSKSELYVYLDIHICNILRVNCLEHPAFSMFLIIRISYFYPVLEIY